MPILFPSGEVLRISKKPLGVGGEGRVFRVANECKQGIVAKIYNQIPSGEHQQKLKTMTTRHKGSLSGFCAWPKELLIDSKSKEICGFTMLEIEDSEPIHHYYSPSWRKQNQPNASWDSLLLLAANLSAAFVAVHESGIIIGDVNPNSLRVKKNGKVFFIDSDSFQIADGNTIYRCRVGVPSFTAPELLESSIPFNKLTRTVNHDLFGLSLLLFHILFMGRHPFAGVFNGSGDTPLETHIMKFRYAYANDYARRGVRPPPLSVQPKSVAAKSLVAAFENDFTQVGAVNGRNSAVKWHELIRKQRESLSRCNHSYGHLYDSILTSCPWCQLERKGLILFNHSKKGNYHSSLETAGLQPSDLLIGKDEERVYRKSQSIDIKKLTFPKIETRDIQPRFALTQKNRSLILIRSLTRIGALVGALAAIMYLPSSGLALAVFLLVIGFAYSPNQLKTLNQGYTDEASEIRKHINLLHSQLQRLLADAHETTHYQTVDCIWNELKSLRPDFERDASDLLLRAQISAKTKFLSSYLLCDAEIRGVGSSRTATLNAFGIETAADLSAERLSSIDGIGPVLMNRLLDWRHTLLQRYVAPSKDVLLQSERHDLLAKYCSLKQKLKNDLATAVNKKISHEASLYAEYVKTEELYVQAVRLEASILADIKLIQSSAFQAFGLRYIWLPI